MKIWNFSTQMSNNQGHNQRETILDYQWLIIRDKIQEKCILVSWSCLVIGILNFSRVILLKFSV